MTSESLNASGLLKARTIPRMTANKNETMNAKSRPTRAALWWLLLLFMLPVQAQEEHTLNLEQAKIRTLISTVSEITGRNFVVDPRVSGEVTVVSANPMDEEEIYEVFLSILKVHGLAAVPSGETIKIVPDSSAKQGTIGMYGDTEGGADAMATHIVQPEHVSATELEPLLRPLIPSTGQLSVHAPANLMVISDSAGNLDRLVRIIERIDTATADSEAEVVRLEHASASEIVRLVNRLYPERGGAGPQVVADERTNTVLLTGDPGSRLRIKTLVAHLDTPLESGGSTRVIYLDYADADELVPILQSVSQALERGDGGEDAGNGSGVSIDAHPATNALIITATPSTFRSLQAVIRQLDIRRAQVLVEAVIAEVAVDTTQELGVQWQAADGFDDDSLIGGTNFGGPGSSILGLSRDPTGAGRGLSLGWLRGTTTIPGTDDVVLELGALARALQSDANTNVLSTPSLVTMDNAEAQIQVGQEVPFLTGQFTSSSADDSTRNPFQTIQREDVGITLKVTPHINQGDTVRLDIGQEVSSVASSSGAAVDLVTNKRTLNTSVLVGDREILVLGGLIDEDVRETNQSVPLLGDIPLLGNLFRYRDASRVKRNLMVFLHPRILRDAATAREVTGGKYDYIRGLQQQAREKDDALTDSEEMPLLPEMYEYLGPREPDGNGDGDG